jgi:ADP-heptose:LPS heptosyltransferase
MSATPAPATPAPQRILIRGVNWLGDAVMTTPALLRLRERFPEARLTLLTPAKLADLWPHHPAVDQVLTFAPGEAPWTVGRRLRDRGFDLGILFPASPRSAWELWWARVPRRVGYAGRWRRWWLTEVVPRPPGYVPMRKRPVREIRRLLRAAADGRPEAGTSIAPGAGAHHLFHYLHLVGYLGAPTEPLAPRLELSAAERAGAAARVRALAGEIPLPAERPWLGLNAGAEYGPAKRWPAANFVAVAREVGRRCGAVWLILGGPADRDLAAEIARQLPGAVNLAGRTGLRDLMQVLAACDLVLTNDTGPMHLAAALGTRVVALFGSTAPELTGPGLPGDPRHAVLRGVAPCAPCFLRVCPADSRCLRALTVEQVTAAVWQQLAAGRTDRSPR